jgi:hypothetical protein
LLLINNLISRYLNNFLFYEKSNLFKISHPIRLCPFIHGPKRPAPPWRGDPDTGFGKGNLDIGWLIGTEAAVEPAEKLLGKPREKLLKERI